MTTMNLNHNATLALRTDGAADATSPVYVELTETASGGLRKRSCMLSLRDAMRLLGAGELPCFKPYMDRQLLLDIHRRLSEQPASAPLAALA